jgi:hypothetical protein
VIVGQGVTGIVAGVATIADSMSLSTGSGSGSGSSSSGSSPSAGPAGSASDAAKNILYPGGRRVGVAGNNAGIRVLPGGAKEAEGFFQNLVTQTGATVDRVTGKGVVASVPGGGNIGFRPSSKSGPPTIDINIPGIDIRKIKFE